MKILAEILETLWSLICLAIIIILFYGLGLCLFGICLAIFTTLSQGDINYTPKYSNYGVVIAKEAEPAERGINPWTLKFEYRPDRYKLILQMEDGRRKEMSIDGVGYMQTNIGDRVRYRY